MLSIINVDAISSRKREIEIIALTKIIQNQEEKAFCTAKENAFCTAKKIPYYPSSEICSKEDFCNELILFYECDNKRDQWNRYEVVIQIGYFTFLGFFTYHSKAAFTGYLFALYGAINMYNLYVKPHCIDETNPQYYNTLNSMF